MLYIVCGAVGFIIGTVFMYISVLRIMRKPYRNKSGRLSAPSKRKREFSKMLALWAVITATAAAIASFVLSAYDKQPVSDFTTVVFSTCVGYLVTYAAKSAVEKTSRNKHGIDENGIPFDDNKGE